MSDIEYVLMPISIVVGLGIARLLEGLYVLTESSKRYWVHTVWLCNKLGQMFLYIWAWRSGGAVGAAFGGAPTFAELLLSIATPSLIFLQALSLLGQQPDRAEDWEERFYSQRFRFFTLNALTILNSGYSTVFFSTGSPVPFAGLLVINGVAITTPNRRAHSVIAVAAAVTVAAGVGAPILSTE